jgi:hypothetical protein
MHGIIRQLQAGQASTEEPLPDLPERCMPFFRLLMVETAPSAEQSHERVRRDVRGPIHESEKLRLTCSSFDLI